MAKNIIIIILVCFLCSFTNSPNENLCITELQTVYKSQVGVREKTGNNDGKDVEKYLKAVGLGSGYSWCAAFVRWCFDQACISTTITGASPTAHNSKNIVYYKNNFNKEPLSGDVFTLYSPSKKRIHHTGFFDKKINDKIFQTVEGNTNIDGSSNGNGVYERKRSFNATYSITRWTK